MSQSASWYENALTLPYYTALIKAINLAVTLVDGLWNDYFVALQKKNRRGVQKIIDWFYYVDTGCREKNHISYKNDPISKLYAVLC